jgi:hypothetical protein
MRKGFLIYEDMMREYLVIYEEAVSHTYMNSRLILSKFPYFLTVYSIKEENWIKVDNSEFHIKFVSKALKYFCESWDLPKK